MYLSMRDKINFYVDVLKVDIFFLSFS